MHGGHHHHHHEISSEKKLFWVFLINLFMSILELIGGLYTNSIAILSDALHDFGDAMALGTGWILEKVSKRSHDKLFSFGYRRFSLLAALINSIILLVGSILIIKEVVPRLFSPEEVKAEAMIGFAILGLIVNGVPIFFLNKANSYNERVITLHLLEDVLGWIAVLIGAIVIKFYNLPILDPILSLLIAMFILKNVYVNLKGILFIFLQGTPQSIDEDRIKQELSNHPSVSRVYHVHIWSLDGQKHILTAHMVLKSSVDIQEFSKIQEWAEGRVQELGLWHSTIQFEIQN